MTKLASLFLSAMLLCGLVAIQAKNNISVAEPQRLPVSVTLVSEHVSPAASAPRALSLKEQKKTAWSDGAGNRLVIYEDGAAYLSTTGETFALKEIGDGFLLEISLYRTRFDESSAMVLPAGTMKITVDGSAMTLAVTEDPLRALAFHGLDGTVLTKREYIPYRGRDYFSGPLEPGTVWFCYSDIGERRYAKWDLTVDETGSMTGTLTMPGGTARPCVLLGSRNSFALVDESGDAPELLLYGERSAIDAKYFFAYRYKLVRVDIDPVYDPLGLCVAGEFEIWRETAGETDLAYMLGTTLDSVILNLIRDGWTETQDMETQYPALDGWFARLTKDGQTLLIHYEYDFSTPYEQDQAFPDAYVLYGADGAVLSWSGDKPIDHRLADAYQLRKGVYFEPGTGVFGMIVGEDSDAYFLDDGRIAVETTAHEGDGDVDFEIIRVIIP